MRLVSPASEAKQTNARPYVCCAAFWAGEGVYGYAEVLALAGCRGAGEAGRRLEETQTRKNRLTGLGLGGPCTREKRGSGRMQRIGTGVSAKD